MTMFYDYARISGKYCYECGFPVIYDSIMIDYDEKYNRVDQDFNLHQYGYFRKDGCKNCGYPNTVEILATRFDRKIDYRLVAFGSA